jgi:predicted site-specific integrase-resolvase
MYRPDPRYLTSAQAAAQLGISRRTLYRWMHEGRIDALLTPERIAASAQAPARAEAQSQEQALHASAGTHSRKPAGRTYKPSRWCI